MKKFLLILILATTSLQFAGCQTTGGLPEAQIIQTVLNEILPANFEGDLEGQHDGFYFGTSIHLTVDLHGLKKNADGKWKWSAGGYQRDGFFSQGHVTLKPKVNRETEGKP